MNTVRIAASALILLLFSKALDCFQFSCAKQVKQHAQPMSLNNRQTYVMTTYGFSLIVDIKDQQVFKALMDEGTWDTNLLFLISKLVRRDQTVLNIGSQNGLQAVILGKIIGKGGRLFVMEPSSLNYRILVKNIHLNNLENITTSYLMAAGMQRNEIYLQASDKKPEKQLLSYRTQDNPDFQFQEVTVEKLDLLLPPATKLDFAYIKSGVYQFQALYGMKEVISQSLSVIILIKNNYFYLQNRDYANAPELFFDFLSKKGFLWFHYYVAEDCNLGKLQPVAWKQLLTPKQNTFLLVGPEVAAQKKAFLGIL